MRIRALPYRIEDDRLKVAVVDPSNIQLTDELRIVSAYPIDLGVAAAADIDAELHRLTRGQEPKSRATLLGEYVPSIEEDAEDVVDLEAADGFSDAPPIELVNSVILQASNDGASDVHFVPQGDVLVVRLRIDGILQEVERIPKEHAAGVISRIKVLAEVDIAEHRMPQDGRMSVRAKTSRRLFDIRVAVLPTVEGEGVIMRLLEKTRPLRRYRDRAFERAPDAAGGGHLPAHGSLPRHRPDRERQVDDDLRALCDVLRPKMDVITIQDPSIPAARMSTSCR